MIKFEYLVLRSFSLVTGEAGERKIGVEPNDKKNMSTFEKGSTYVDYKFPTETTKKGDITENLKIQKYIELVRRIESK